MHVEFPERPLFETRVPPATGAGSRPGRDRRRKTAAGSPIRCTRRSTAPACGWRRRATSSSKAPRMRRSACTIEAIALRTRDRLRRVALTSRSCRPTSCAMLGRRLSARLPGQRSGHADAARLSSRAHPRLSAALTISHSSMIDYVPRWLRGGGHWMTIYCWGRAREFPAPAAAGRAAVRGRRRHAGARALPLAAGSRRASAADPAARPRGIERRALHARDRRQGLSRRASTSSG